MSAARTFRLTAPHMSGSDVRDFQGWLHRKLESWGADDYPLPIDADYGVATRSAVATVLHGMGIAQEAMDEGVTPRLRVKMRDNRLTPAERARYVARGSWRKALAQKHKGGGVCSPLAKIITHANGYRPPGHDGVDLICPRDAPGFAICRARVIRADNGGWWGKGAPSAAVAAKGDGILILRSLVDIGPIRKGMNFGYGHGEDMRVKEGDIVEAGQRVCRAGMANAPHFHLMVNMRGDDRGVGDRDPWPIVEWVIDHS